MAPTFQPGLWTATISELDDWELKEYCEHYGLLKQFDFSITKTGLLEWLRDNPTRESENIELQSILCYAVENGQGSLVSKLLNNLEGHGRVDYQLIFNYALLSGQCVLVELLVEKQLVDPRKSICWPQGNYDNNIIIDTKDNRDPWNSCLTISLLWPMEV